MTYSKDRPKRRTEIQKRYINKTDRELIHMILKKRIGIAWAVVALVLVLGCAEREDATDPAPAATSPEGASVGTPGSAPYAANDPSDAAKRPQTEQDAESEKNKNNISVASPQKDDVVPATPELGADGGERTLDPADEARQEFNRRNYDVTGTFDPAHPTLMGLSVGLDASAVVQRFGEPADTYPLPDEEVDASVLAYPGFTVGISDNRVLFVEVSTNAVNPGLNGLRLGDAKSDAIAALGTPSAETEFVVSYVADGSVLKLDVDPESETIHSIKLFPEE